MPNIGWWAVAGAGGAAVASDYELISTYSVGTAVAQVDLDVSGLTQYKHLQIRWTGRSATTGSLIELAVRLNSNTGSNYAWHFLRGDGTSVSSSASSPSTNAMFVGQLSGASAGASVFGAGVLDILDAYSTTKNKTLRGLSGVMDSSGRVNLYSGVFLNTGALTTISLYSQNLSSNIEIGSRFSIYGLKG